MRRALALLVAALAALGLSACEHLDRGFGTDGRVALAVQPAVGTRSGDGIAVLGTASGKPYVVRYDAEGRRDTTFGTRDGYAPLVGVSLTSATAMATLPDGGFVVASRISDGHAGIVRYTAAGVVDSGYGDGGVARSAVAFSPGSEVAVAPDGRIALVELGLNRVAMFTAAGRPDTGFGRDGVVTIDLSAHFDAAAFDADGRLVVGGSNAHVVVARLLRDGSLDQTFGLGGVARVSTGDPYNEFPTGVVVQPDGRIVVLARRFADGGEKQLLVRFLADGRRDDAFGLGGLSIEGGAFDRAEGRSLHLRPDGRIVTAGQTFEPDDLVTTQWTADGKLDGSWGEHGDDVTDLGGRDGLFGAVLLADGRLLGYGMAADQPVLVRYTKP